MQLPADFILGTGTSAFQIEGALREDGRGPSIWDDFRGQNGDTGRIACDHYRRYREDVTEIARMGCDAYRFSIAWPRVYPEGKGKVNRKGLDFYSRLVDSLLEQSVSPWVTLYHWELPLALHREGGWPNRDTAEHFADYCQTVVEALGDRVDRWFTINEPWTVTVLGYETGQHAPCLKCDRQTALRVIHHLFLAHGLALQRIRAAGDKHQVGIVLNPWIPMPLSQRVEDLEASETGWREQVGWWLDPVFRGCYPQLSKDTRPLSFSHVREGDMRIISAEADHLGLNMYFPDFVRHVSDGECQYEEYSAMVNLPRSEMGWLCYPTGLSYLLSEVTRRYNPKRIYVTENGCAAPDVLDDRGEIHDLFRLEYLRSHLLEALLARQNGVPLAGYFIWALMDNFEWDRGYSKRFGLLYTDYQTQCRHWKASAHWFSQVSASRSLVGTGGPSDRTPGSRAPKGSRPR